MLSFVDPAVASAFDGGALVTAMLAVEAALARASAEVGFVPRDAADRIVAATHEGAFDVARIVADGALAGNIAIPLVKALTERVAAKDPAAAEFVHRGATSQDVLDTAFALQLRTALRVVHRTLGDVDAALATLAERHASTPLAARTWLQQAGPTTFGRKVAGWLAAVRRTRAQLRDARRAACVLQFGGATGTLASFGGLGLAVGEALARELDLAMPALPWHAERDRQAMLAAACGAVAGVLGKIARDVSLLAQTEIAEATEPGAPGRGGSSAMPQKRNPVGCAIALAAAVRTPGLVATMFAALPQEHERALGGWQAEWDTLPELVGLLSGSALAMAETLAGLNVDAKRMRENLDAAYGLAMAESLKTALAGAAGSRTAHELVETLAARAVAEGRALRDVAAGDPVVRRHLSPDAVARACDPNAFLGEAETFVRRALADVPT